MPPLFMHVDMDAFYASVEQLDCPDLRGVPVIVGGERRGVVCAASYEARRYGIHSAMPMFQARKKCPKAVFLPVRMKRYREVSRKVMEVLNTLSPAVEQISIDEAYLDLTGMEQLWAVPSEAGREAKRRVLAATGITCSVGIASLKFLSKVASAWNKPDGLTWIPAEETERVLRSLPLPLLPGAGRRTLDILGKLGVESAGDLLKLPESWIRDRLGRHGLRLLRQARGEEIGSIQPDHVPRSVSAEDTFDRDLEDGDQLRRCLLSQCERVAARLRRKDIVARTVVLKIKKADFTLLTRRRTLTEPVDDAKALYDAVLALLQRLHPQGGIRLSGVGVTNLSGREGLPFWDAGLVPNAKNRALNQALDFVRDRYGDRSIRRGSLLDLE